MVNYKKIGKLLVWRCRQKKQLTNQLPQATAPNQEVEEVPAILLPCGSCGRTFRPEALAKHSKVCEKTLMKKRKTFDSSKQRLQGTEVESYSTPVLQTKSQKKRVETKAKERIDLSKALAAVKKPVESPVSAVVKPSDHEECPYCGRSFGPKAYDRHTQFCKEQQLKLKMTPSNSEAVERLKVRTSYRGPLTNKVLNRDRYQPKRDPSPLSNDRQPRMLSRNTSLRSSLRMTRSSETTPPPPLRRSHSQITPTKSRRGREENGEGEERKRLSDGYKMEAKEKKKEVTTQQQTMPKLYPREAVTENRESELYNPYITAERQMLELFGGEEGKPKPEPTLPDIPQSSPIQSSQTSAFVKYSSPKTSPSLELFKTDNNKNNNETVLTEDSFDGKIDNCRNFSLSNLSLCSVVSIDSIDCNKNPKSNDLQRSFSAFESRTSRAHTRTKVNLQEMLYGSRSPEQAPHSESSNSDAGNLEACEAELLESMLEFEKMLKSSPIPSPHSSPPPPLCSSSAESRHSSKLTSQIEARKNHKNINGSSIDSAYSRSSEEKERGAGDLPAFCHECGSRYPVAAAKFCCNCGMRRILI